MSQEYSEAVQLMYSTFATSDFRTSDVTFTMNHTSSLDVFITSAILCKSVLLIEHVPQLGDVEM
jgi:hypothetical protein